MAPTNGMAGRARPAAELGADDCYIDQPYSPILSVQLTEALGIPPLASPAPAAEDPLPEPAVMVVLVMVVGVVLVIIIVMVELEELEADTAEPAIPEDEMWPVSSGVGDLGRVLGVGSTGRLFLDQSDRGVIKETRLVVSIAHTSSRMTDQKHDHHSTRNNDPIKQRSKRVPGYRERPGNSRYRY